MHRLLLLFFCLSLSSFAAEDLLSCAETLTDKTPSSVEESDGYLNWESFSRRWITSVEKIMKYGSSEDRGPRLPAYRNAYYINDSRTRDLKLLGIHEDSQRTPRFIRVPKLDKLVSLYQETVNSWVESGKILPSETLVPGVLVRDKTGSLLVVPFGRKVEHCKEVDVSSRPSLFTYMVALGIVPISSGHRALHDINHLRGLLLSPTYMKEIRALAQIYSGPNSGLPWHDRYVRFFHVYEGLALLPPAHRAELETLLTAGARGDYQAIERMLNLENPFNVVQRAKLLAKFAISHLNFFGGASEIGTAYSNPELVDSLARLLPQLVYELKTPWDEVDPDRLSAKMLGALSRFEVALYYSSQVTLEEYFEAVKKRRQPDGTVLSRWYNPSFSAVSDGIALFSLSLAGQLTEEHAAAFSQEYLRLPR